MREKFSQLTIPTPPTHRIQSSPQDERFKEFLEVVDRVGDRRLKLVLAYKPLVE